MSDRQRGPNGFAYVDLDRSKIGAWESGEFNVKICRCDERMLRVNFRPEELEALREAITHTLDEAAAHDQIDYEPGENGGASHDD